MVYSFEHIDIYDPESAYTIGPISVGASLAVVQVGRILLALKIQARTAG
jgi:hypothetical protein